jgi:hypothetical protein
MTDDLFGFGVWLDREMTLADGSAIAVIRVPWFAANQRFHGERDSAERSCAGSLYSTLETRARLQLGDRPVELFCDERNERGLRFWCRRGFTDIGTAIGAEHLRHLLRQ